MSLPIKAFSPREVRQVIEKVNQHKAPGYDLITGEILKQLPNKAIVLLLTIYNSMLKLSYFLAIRRFAQITMIPKPGKAGNEVTSYRSISLLPITSKIFEKLLLNRLRNDTEIQGITPDYSENIIPQSKKHRIVNKITASLEKRQFCTAAFLDIAQAINIKNKFPSPYYLLLKSYISERYFLFRPQTSKIRSTTKKCVGPFTVLNIHRRFTNNRQHYNSNFRR
jgi:hypothetical protein